MTPTGRNLVIIDTETTGLHANAAILEVAAINVDTGEEFYFVPKVTPHELANAEPDALSINRYYERKLYREALDDTGTSTAWGVLASMLRLNTLGGSNPTFDANLIAPKTERVWHHRLADLAAYAAGKLDIDPTELPGLAAVCELLDVINEGEHSALADARATAECFRRLRGGFGPILAVPQFGGTAA